MCAGFHRVSFGIVGPGEGRTEGCYIWAVEPRLGSRNMCYGYVGALRRFLRRKEISSLVDEHTHHRLPPHKWEEGGGSGEACRDQVMWGG